MAFSLSQIPDIRFGAGEIDRIAEHAQSLGEVTRALIVMDGFLAGTPLRSEMIERLEAAGIACSVYSDFAGEPKLAHLRAAAASAEAADLVIGIGGGSALDIAKIVACTAASGEDPMHYALAAHPLPRRPLKKIMVPTTAGTGSETSATNIFSGENGKKLWIWGKESKADLVILDPELTTSLPPALTAWCGLDAFIHAFEASTNRNAQPIAKLFGHEALRMISENLVAAVRHGDDLEARGQVLLGSCYAGVAIDNCGTAIAHNISHALAGLAPVHHGFATALGFEATIGWLAETGEADLEEAAFACDLGAASDLPAFFSSLMDECGIERRLPPPFAAFSAADLASEMRAVENQPMLRATIRTAEEADIDRFAAAIMALAPAT